VVEERDAEECVGLVRVRRRWSGHLVDGVVVAEEREEMEGELLRVEGAVEGREEVAEDDEEDEEYSINLESLIEL
jgi:hypothetical protein